MEKSERYLRQTVLPELGESGQQKLMNAKVLVVGVGGLGSPASIYLTAAGVGTLGLVDDDVVSISNLQRQILYTEDEVGLSKAECATRRLHALNSDVKIETCPFRLTQDNVADIVEIINFMNDQASEHFNEQVADITGEGDVNQEDINALLFLIMTPY